TYPIIPKPPSIFPAAITCAAIIPNHAKGITIDAIFLACSPKKWPSNPGNEYLPYRLILPASGARTNKPKEAQNKNHNAAQPIDWLNSIVPNIAEPPKIVANKLPETGTSPAFLPAT